MVDLSQKFTSFAATDNKGVVLEPFREIDAMLHQPNHFFLIRADTPYILLFIPHGFLLPMILE